MSRQYNVVMVHRCHLAKSGFPKFPDAPIPIARPVSTDAPTQQKCSQCPNVSEGNPIQVLVKLLVLSALMHRVLSYALKHII